ncbi:hypothetical protein [Bradyrhizobium sp. AZCC 1699]|uniref:hypothetical protein n=1 Tax=Bradyrhizobium sp. AZCC 1699 TaxID=3117024 RepID=UPI002FF41E9A
MAGGSHTNFESTAFSVGAVAGAATIAGALGAGLADLRAQRAAANAGWREHQLRAALELSELLRRREHRVNRAQRITIARFERERAIARANRHLSRS